MQLGNYDYTDVADVNITKDVTIAGTEGTTITSTGDGTPIFNVPAKSEDGPSEVSITGVDFKLNNGDTVYADVDAGRITYPVFVKPVRGSASIAISKVYDRDTVELLFAHNNNLMIQEFLDGQEIGADVYIDMCSGEVVSIFTKKKIVMRAGETDKAVSFKDTKLFALIEKFVSDSGWRGQIDIDIFEVGGEYFISEVNPRFGGGYPHAYECGCDPLR